MRAVLAESARIVHAGNHIWWGMTVTKIVRWFVLYFAA